MRKRPITRVVLEKYTRGQWNMMYYNQHGVVKFYSTKEFRDQAIDVVRTICSFSLARKHDFEKCVGGIEYRYFGKTGVILNVQSQVSKRLHDAFCDIIKGLAAFYDWKVTDNRD